MILLGNVAISTHWEIGGMGEGGLPCTWCDTQEKLANDTILLLPINHKISECVCLAVTNYVWLDLGVCFIFLWTELLRSFVGFFVCFGVGGFELVCWAFWKRDLASEVWKQTVQNSKCDWSTNQLHRWRIGVHLSDSQSLELLQCASILSFPLQGLMLRSYWRQTSNERRSHPEAWLASDSVHLISSLKCALSTSYKPV